MDGLRGWPSSSSGASEGATRAFFGRRAGPAMMETPDDRSNVPSIMTNQGIMTDNTARSLGADDLPYLSYSMVANEKPGQMNRRTFLKVTGAAGGAVAATYLLGSNTQLLREVFAATTQNGVELSEEWVPTTCWIGKQDCGVLARVVNGRIVKLEGNPLHPRNRGTLCVKGMAQIQAVYDPYRVKAPLERVNAKGEPGQWKEISWDAALTTVASKMQEVIARDPRLLLWQKGRSKAKSFYDKAFVNASGATLLHHGAHCSDAGYRACEYTIGMHGVLHPDFRHCRYMISWGWNITGAGGNKFCWITWPREFVAARERGMKVVHLDPQRLSAGPHADTWLPIRPGGDLMFWLAIANQLIAKGHVDREYLSKYTNSNYLVRPDGHFLRDSQDKEMVWDANTGAAVPFDAAGTDPAFEGQYDVGGETVRPAYQLFKDNVAKYPPNVAAELTDIPASKIVEIAVELGENAMIGSTIEIEGQSFPHRPVGIMAYHVSQQELGFQAVRAACHVMMLLGAIYTPGGLFIDTKPAVHSNFSKFENLEVKDPPYNLYLKDSKFYPINSNNSSLVAHVLQDRAKYGVDYLPEVMIVHMCNLLSAFPDQPKIAEFLGKMKFIAVVDPWLSETADYYADIVLPAATMEKYEGPVTADDQYESAKTLRMPPIPPLFQSRGDIDIYLDLCEKAGLLTGPGGYIDEINSQLKLKDEFKLDTSSKPTTEGIFDRWARSQGFEAGGVAGLDYFRKVGVTPAEPVPATTLYPYADTEPFGGNKHRLYGEGLLKIQEQMKVKGADEIYWRDYTPLPSWRTPTIHKSPPEYDLTLISRKLIEFKQSRSTFIPALSELEPSQRVEMNPSAAAARGIGDGDEVVVESHNAISGEVRQVSARARLTQCIRPDTVCMPHHFGAWVHPRTKNSGPTPNTLFFTGEGYVTNTADQTFQVAVRVRSAG